MGKWVIFDMDGVIVDSEYVFLSTKTNMLLDRGIDTNETYQYQFMGTTFNDMWRVMKEECQLSDSVEELIAEMNDRREEIIARDGIRAIKGIKELLNYLVDLGYQLAVASSSPKADIDHNLLELGLSQYFAVTVSGEEVAHSKPAPDVFLKAAELLGATPEETFVFEDTKNGSLAAKAAGMICLGFVNPDYPKQDMTACDYVFEKFEDSYCFFR
ncbi:HAD family hydrolase [Streptococcus pseudoporcinus]|uniref:Haloacid dehalogenase-like hydrolase n=1 Tax=Streptococcus pseudoporcinus LQ 940-04 TaxID=875093 RepID=G5K8W3_9STRE|nr:HAD-IA family hydrolase [Streptococcus pseudoporcinus]EFR43989.1 HAD hydrolase, family IA, variant 3 [Streptococcus pseudoporcinus SPIN 20026]EHI64989.1 haloacid dehalogenase-like hydrolase [Streptococcus pseudoporcinus LQ 940-04]VEF93366.1 haloacid dehalogenase [Streptococcus pseudoporcinus]